MKQMKQIPAQSLTGVVVKTLIGQTPGSHITTPQEKVFFIEGHGIKGDNHAGQGFLTVRDSAALHFGHAKGTPVRNTREWSAVSEEEMRIIADEMSLLGISPGCLGENLVIAGILDFTKLPPGTKLFFKSPRGELRTTILFVCGENIPCHIPAEAIQAENPDKPGLLKKFLVAAKHRRGLVGIVIGGGFVKEGDMVVAEVPEQTPYSV